MLGRVFFQKIPQAYAAIIDTKPSADARHWLTETASALTPSGSYQSSCLGDFCHQLVTIFHKKQSPPTIHNEHKARHCLCTANLTYVLERILLSGRPRDSPGAGRRVMISAVGQRRQRSTLVASACELFCLARGAAHGPCCRWRCIGGGEAR